MCRANDYTLFSLLSVSADKWNMCFTIDTTILESGVSYSKMVGSMLFLCYSFVQGHRLGPSDTISFFSKSKWIILHQKVSWHKSGPESLILQPGDKENGSFWRHLEYNALSLSWTTNELQRWCRRSWELQYSWTYYTGGIDFSVIKGLPSFPLSIKGSTCQSSNRLLEVECGR